MFQNYTKTCVLTTRQYYQSFLDSLHTLLHTLSLHSMLPFSDSYSLIIYAHTLLSSSIIKSCHSQSLTINTDSVQSISMWSVLSNHLCVHRYVMSSDVPNGMSHPSHVRHITDQGEDLFVMHHKVLHTLIWPCATFAICLQMLWPISQIDNNWM